MRGSRAIRAILAMVLSVGFVGAPTPSAWAGRSTGAGSCEITNPGPATVALKGTLAVEVFLTNLGGNLPMDAMLRLEKGGVVRFFYVTFFAPLLTNDQTACDVLEVLTPALQAGFGLPGRSFCITDKSLSKADAGDIVPFPGNGLPPRALSAADITVYALQGSC